MTGTNQTGKFVLHNRDLGCAISDQVRAQARKFWKYFSQARSLRKRACKMLLRNF